MTNLLEIARSLPSRRLMPAEELIAQGSAGGDLFILEDGELSVERDGISVATVRTANALVGEMSVLLGTPASATVRAVGHVTVRVVADARQHLMNDPELLFRIAALVAGRLDATTALLVDLSREHPGEQGLLARILSAIHLPAETDQTVTRRDLFG